MGSEVYHTLGKILKAKYGQDSINVGDEGGFAPAIRSSEEGLDLLVEAISKAGYEGKIKICMDVAASEFYVEGSASQGGSYDLAFKTPDRPNVISGSALMALYASYAAKYPIVSIEDPFEQDDWANYGVLSAKMGDSVQIVGDDLLVTNPVRGGVPSGKIVVVLAFALFCQPPLTLTRSFLGRYCRSGLPRAFLRRLATHCCSK